MNGDGSSGRGFGLYSSRRRFQPIPMGRQGDIFKLARLLLQATVVEGQRAEMMVYKSLE